MLLVENPFAVLTAVVAPAILTNACSVLSLGTANRVARVVDRKRAPGIWNPASMQQPRSVSPSDRPR